MCLGLSVEDHPGLLLAGSVGAVGGMHLQAEWQRGVNELGEEGQGGPKKLIEGFFKGAADSTWQR